jgi:hypothetical protein
VRAVEPDSQLRRLFEEYEKAGGIVGYAIFEVEPPEEVDVDAHRRAAMLTVAKAMRRDQAWELDDAADRPTAADVAAMSPVKISAQEFFGPLWAPTREVLIVHGRSDRFLNDYFYANDPETTRHVLDHLKSLPEIGTGYSYAFSDPPYRMHCSNQRLSELFVEINQQLFPYDLYAAGVEIYRWPTHFSSYFDAGDEWWGSFLWTVSWPGWRIVGLTASTTD